MFQRGCHKRILGCMQSLEMWLHMSFSFSSNACIRPGKFCYNDISSYLLVNGYGKRA